jgi:hypothetical protein
MKETPEVLLKRTRSELSEIAEKLGIDTVGISKTKIADFIFEARKKTEKAPAKEASKPRAEAPKAGKAFKEQPRPHIGTNIGKKGVFAKRAAISAQMDVNAEAVAAIGIGVNEIHKGINAQIKDNEKAAAKMGTGIKEMHKGIKETRSAMDKKAKEMLQEGAAKLQKGVNEMHKGINAQIKDNEKAAEKMQEGIHELETKFGEFQNETANYIKDFYYG